MESQEGWAGTGHAGAELASLARASGARGRVTSGASESCLGKQLRALTLPFILIGDAVAWAGRQPRRRVCCAPGVLDLQLCVEAFAARVSDL